MSKSDTIRVSGTVVKCERGGMFRVRLDNGHMVLCMPSGAIRKRYIKIILDDRVDVELSAYDFTRGRIVWRHKD